MKEELDKQLVEKYPKIFANRYKSMQETCMCWGFECHSGWYDLIDNLCGKIQHYLDQQTIDSPFRKKKSKQIEQVVADQVKEKYGTLCFYYSGGNEYIRGLVDMVECLSYSTCESCGNPGKFINDAGWFKVRCDKCLEIDLNYANSLKQAKLDLKIQENE